MENGAPARVVPVSTLPEAAADIAEVLVRERPAACVNLLPGATSVYRWQDEIYSDRETILVIKTPAGAISALEDRVRRLHPSRVPEIPAFAASESSADYLAWLAESVVASPAS